MGFREFCFWCASWLDSANWALCRRSMARILLDRIDLAYLGIYFLLAALVFVNSYRRASSGILRQQLKWVTGGTLAGILPFLCLYVVPYSFGDGAASVDEPFRGFAGR